MSYQSLSKPYINTAVFEEVLSAKTFDIKKLSSRNEYILCTVPTISQIVANAPATKAVIPEVSNYLRYTAAIRALEHNCNFINKAMEASNSGDIKELCTLNYDYKNGKPHAGIRSSSKRYILAAPSFYQSSLYILEESKHLIQFFEDMLLIDKLSKIIPDFKTKLDKATKFKQQCIEKADNLINDISQNKDSFNYFVNYISNSANLDTKPADLKLVK